MLLEAEGYLDTTHTITKSNMLVNDVGDRLREGFKRHKNYKALGNGQYAHVFSRHKGEGDERFEVHPHHVIKVMHSSARQSHMDGTIQYLKAASKKADENPHFPRVHHIHSIESEDGSTHVIKLEKLHTWHEVNDEERLAAFNHAFHHDPPDHILQDHKSHDDRVHDFGRYVSDQIHHYAEGYPPFSHIRHAVETIKGISKKSKGMIYVDMHPGNFMVRRTPVGPQLVITDPVVGREWSGSK